MDGVLGMGLLRPRRGAGGRVWRARRPAASVARAEALAGARRADDARPGRLHQHCAGPLVLARLAAVDGKSEQKFLSNHFR